MNAFDLTSDHGVAQIGDLIRLGECIQVTLSEDAGGERFSGIPLALSDTFMMLLMAHDWAPDGAAIFPRAKIVAVEPEPGRGKVLAWAGMRSTNAYFWVDLSDYPALFQSLKRRDRFVTVEDGDELEVAKVAAIAPTYVKLAVIDDEGEWMEDMVDFPYEEISVVAVDRRYSNVLGQYCQRDENRPDV